MRLVLRILVHALLFLASIVVFYLGLGVGLAYDPTLGTAIWALAGCLLFGNLAWIVVRLKGKRQAGA